MTGIKKKTIDGQTYFRWYWTEYSHRANADRVARRLQSYNIRTHVTDEYNGYTIWANEQDWLKAMGNK